MTPDEPRSANGLHALGPLLPLAAVLSTLPYTFVYFSNLWKLPHYQFFPLVVVAVVVLAWQRWGGLYVEGTRLLRRLRLALLGGGIFGALCATLFASPWMGYFGFAFSLAGWLGYHRDRETGRSLLYLALPIFLIWQPPYNTIVTADTILIQSLQSLSTRLSSQSLDILGYAHHQPGTILEFAGRSFGVAEACSGIQSFFAVLCLGALLTAFFRRGAMHAGLLLVTCPVWAILMNTIRITSIPISYTMFGVDLSRGVLHEMLGYCTMALAMGLLLSTDELLLKLREQLPPTLVDPSPAQSRTVTGSPSPARAVGGVSAAWHLALVAPLALIFCLSFGIQAYDVSQSWGQQRNVIDFFRDEPLIELVRGDAPSELLGWEQKQYAQYNRASENDDLGQRSDLWHYQAPFGTVALSFDQMFPGWHELTRCYRNTGWQPKQRVVMEASQANGWPIVLVEMTRGNEHGYLVFSLADRSGAPLQPPGDYSYWTILQERLRGRLTPAVRGAIFGAAAYQIQAFVSTYVPLPESERRATVERFMAARETLWAAAQRHIDS